MKIDLTLKITPRMVGMRRVTEKAVAGHLGTQGSARQGSAGRRGAR